MTIPDLLSHPYFSAAIAVLTAAIVALLRWRLPEQWAALPKRLQVVPALVVAASLSGGLEVGKALSGLGEGLVPLLRDFATTTVLAWLGSMGTQQAAKRIPSPPSPGSGIGRLDTIHEDGTVTRTHLRVPPDSAAFGVVAIVLALVLTACTPAQRATARTALDAARILCLLSHAEQLGVSPEEVKEALCEAEEQVRPWLPHVLGAQRAGAESIGLKATP